MKLLKMGKKYKDEIKFGIWWVKWLKNRAGQGCIFHFIIAAHYTF